MIEIKSLNTINKSAEEFINQIGYNKVFAFNGKMGAGKTTFIKAVCEVLGVKETINSPTFSIVNEYETENGQIIYHFDCYRIKNVQEAIDMGTEEYLYSENLCFIEWAENIAPLLPELTVNVDIVEIENNKRNITLK